MITIALLIVVCTMYLSGAMSVGPTGALTLWLLLSALLLDILEGNSD